MLIHLAIFRPKKRLEEVIVEAAWQQVGNHDAIILVVDAKKGICADTQSIIDACKQQARNNGHFSIKQDRSCDTTNTTSPNQNPQ